jgi:ribose transport system substrate-binding protein
MGRNDVVVTTVDLADQDAKIIAKCGALRAAATQLPYDEGIAEGKLLVKALIGAEVPKYVVTDTPLATHENVLDVYQAVYHRAAPREVADAYVKSCG